MLKFSPEKRIRCSKARNKNKSKVIRTFLMKLKKNKINKKKERAKGLYILARELIRTQKENSNQEEIRRELV